MDVDEGSGKYRYLALLDMSGWMFIRDICTYEILTLKVSILNAEDDNFAIPFPITKIRYDMRIVCQQNILIKYHALFVIFEKAAKFAIAVCCKL